MAHASENSDKLEIQKTVIFKLQQLENIQDAGKVYLLHFPARRTNQDALNSQVAFQKISDFCSRLNIDSTICILTTPPDAAQLQPYLERSLRFQLWIAVKSSIAENKTQQGKLTEHHTALLVLTRYHESLRHAKTRIRYSYCPACGKTTKDYGGKKHLYHEYGTLMSDVWRDIQIDPQGKIDEVTGRLCDLFGIAPYKTLEYLDLSCCTDLAPKPEDGLAKEQIALFQLPEASVIPTRSRLINRDCLQALRSIPDNSIDFCFADPPVQSREKIRWV